MSKSDRVNIVAGLLIIAFIFAWAQSYNRVRESRAQVSAAIAEYDRSVNGN